MHLPNFVLLQIVGLYNREINLWVKPTTQMVKVKKAYSERIGMPVSRLGFYHNGLYMENDDTPATLEIQQDDEIEAYVLEYEGQWFPACA